MTPAAFHAYVRGFIEGQKDEAEIWQAQLYNLAVMVRVAIGAKRMPEYKRFFPPRKKRGPMSDEAMYQQVLALNRALGGRTEGEA